MRPRLHQVSYVAMWIAGLLICVLAASGIVAIVRLAPTAEATIPDRIVQSRHGTAQGGSEAVRAGDASPQVAAAQVAKRRNRSWECQECGVVASLRRVENLRNADTEAVGHSLTNRGRGEDSSGGLAPNVISGAHYEITVRFHDGSTSVFHDTAPFAWRLGSRVIVLAGSPTSND